MSNFGLRFLSFGSVKFLLAAKHCLSQVLVPHLARSSTIRLDVWTSEGTLTLEIRDTLSHSDGIVFG